MTAKSGEEAVLMCPAVAEPQVQYRAISWYKISAEGLNGILRQDRQRHTISMFEGFSRPVKCATPDCLLLSLGNLTCEDAGDYCCTLWAPLGHQIKEGTIHLSIKECTTMKHLLSEMLALAALCAVGTFLIGAGINKILARQKAKMPVDNKLEYFLIPEIPLQEI